VAIWCLCAAGLTIAPNKKIAAILDRTIYILGSFIPSFFAHFILILIDKVEEKKTVLKYFYAGSLVFCLLSFTNIFIKEWMPKEPYFNFISVPNVGYFIFCLIFFIPPIYAALLLTHAYKQERIPNRKHQFAYVIIASVIGFASPTTYFLMVYGVVTRWLPTVTIFIIVYIGLTAYAIVRHQLLEIEVVIKRSLVFAGLLASVMAIIILPTLVMQEIFFQRGGFGLRLVGLTISGIILILAIRKIDNFLRDITDKVLFQKKYDYKRLIKEFMNELKTMVLNAPDIAQSTLEFLASSIRPTKSAIFMHNRYTNKYDIIASTNLRDKAMRIPASVPLAKELEEKGETISLRQNKSLLDETTASLSKEGTELLVPLVMRKELIGILSLGKKKSDEEYTEEDIGALSNLSSALSIAINNAQLFAERAEAERRAAIGTLATSINHEIGNPLNVISVKLQSLYILSEEGLLEKKSKKEIIDEVTTSASICLDSVHRISDIARKIYEFSKPDKALALDKVNVTSAIDETISILAHELTLDHIDFEEDIKCPSPYIIADRGQFKQILFNLIKNAAQAIGHKEGKITLLVEGYEEDKITIKITDTGPGIPEKELNKIFMPFYTTKEPGKGTGLGLALVKRLVERNKGDIEVTSHKDTGTTFTMTFKGGCS